ncbi:MAG: AAA-associated domain-containing protein [Candidatus Marsarchaeota archaeon]|nr:AAA-associated domain-containing protein [Candidatus Marsarchaeota archaeon]MCL5413555.1 AAA-associated domain-containing protein [Candidatus Marsarchaeota archaeon]
MEGLFPLGTGISRVRGIVNLIKQHKGRMEISELAEESEEDVDDLLPLIEACKMLKFVTVEDSVLRLTEKGARLTFSNFSKSIKEGLDDVEPFKSTLKIVNERQITSAELFSKLRSRGIMFHGDEAANDIMLKRLLIRWGVRSKLIEYDPQNDVWSKARV